MSALIGLLLAAVAASAGSNCKELCRRKYASNMELAAKCSQACLQLAEPKQKLLPEPEPPAKTAAAQTLTLPAKQAAFKGGLAELRALQDHQAKLRQKCLNIPGDDPKHGEVVAECKRALLSVARAIEKARKDLIRDAEFTVSAVSGSGELCRGGGTLCRPLQPGEPVHIGDTIKMGPDGQADLLIHNSCRLVRLLPKTSFVLSSEGNSLSPEEYDCEWDPPRPSSRRG